MLIKCGSCHKRFTFNPEKHRHDKVIFCPWCRNEIKNPTKISFTWKPSLSWIHKKLAERKARNEALKFLDKYFPKDPKGERAFSVNSWMKGTRPKLSINDVKQVLGKKPSQIEIENEIWQLKKLGVRVK